MSQIKTAIFRGIFPDFFPFLLPLRKLQIFEIFFNFFAETS